MQAQSLELIKIEVEKVFGKKIITYVDCLQLSEEIYRKTSERLSLNTLRRAFCLIKSNHAPSQQTLTILARYCCFFSVEELVKKRTANQHLVQEEEGLLHYLVALFQNTRVTHDNDATYIDMVRHTIAYLQKDPRIVDAFQLAIAKTKNGQSFYYEHFVNIDKLAGYYGDGLYYYLNEKLNVEAQVFGHSLLCLRYWLTDEPSLFERHYKEVMRYKINDSIHPFVCARYFAVQLLHAHIKGENCSSIMVAARAFYEGMGAGHTIFKEFPCFELLITDKLLLVNEPEEALFYIDKVLRKDVSIAASSYVDPHLFRPFILYKAMARAKLGEMDRASFLYDKVDPNSFYFLSSQYHTILHIQLGIQLRKVRVYEQQLHHLIQVTGFKKLEQKTSAFALHKVGGQVA